MNEQQVVVVWLFENTGSNKKVMLERQFRSALSLEQFVIITSFQDVVYYQWKGFSQDKEVFICQQLLTICEACVYPL